MTRKIETLLENLGRLWCKFAHTSVMWPIHGQYRCRTCLRLYPVPWEPHEAKVELRPEAIDIGFWKKAA